MCMNKNIANQPEFCKNKYILAGAIFWLVSLTSLRGFLEAKARFFLTVRFIYIIGFASGSTRILTGALNLPVHPTSTATRLRKLLQLSEVLP